MKKALIVAGAMVFVGVAVSTPAEPAHGLMMKKLKKAWKRFKKGLRGEAVNAGVNVDAAIARLRGPLAAARQAFQSFSKRLVGARLDRANLMRDIGQAWRKVRNRWRAWRALAGPHLQGLPAVQQVRQAWEAIKQRYKALGMASKTKGFGKRIAKQLRDAWKGIRAGYDRFGKRLAAFKLNTPRVRAALAAAAMKPAITRPGLLKRLGRKIKKFFKRK